MQIEASNLIHNTFKPENAPNSEENETNYEKSITNSNIFYV